MRKFLLYVNLIVLICLQNVLGQDLPYKIPDPKIEAFVPKGLRITIPVILNIYLFFPYMTLNDGQSSIIHGQLESNFFGFQELSLYKDSPGVQLFGFHGKINQAFSGSTSSSDPGSIDIDASKASSGVWVLEEPNLKLEVGDTIYYWMFVQYKNLGYRKEDGRWEVKALLKSDGTIGEGPETNPDDPPNASCEPTATKVNGQSSCRGKLIFSDDFNKPKLDVRKWTLESRIPNEPDYEFVTYQRDPKNCFIDNGNLVFAPTIINDNDYITAGTLNLSQACTGRAGTSECIRNVENYIIIPPVVSARISSLPYFSFLYGKVEIRAKLPAGDWIFPELYLLPKDHEYGPDYDSGKMLVAFSPGNAELKTVEDRQINSQVLSGGLMLSQTDPLKSAALRSKTSRDASWNEDFHTYTLIWRPDQVTVAVDQVTYGSIVVPAAGFKSLGELYKSKNTKKWRNPTSPIDREFYLVLGLGAGGITDFPDNSVSGLDIKPWKNKSPKALLNFYSKKDDWSRSWKEATTSRLQIDYVKVWAL